MTEKLKLDLFVVLPDVADERDVCVGRLSRLLQAEGLEKVHVIHEGGRTRLCLHYDPQQFSVSPVRELAQESTLARMVEMVAEAQTQKSPT